MFGAGDWFDDPNDIWMYGRPNVRQQLTLNPYLMKVLTKSTNMAPEYNMCVPYIRTTEVSNNDPLQDRLNRRMSDKIFVKGFSLQGQLKLPINCLHETIQVSIVEVKTCARHQSEVDSETEFTEMINLTCLRPLTGFQRVSTQEEPLFRKTNKVIYNKEFKLSNSTSITQSKVWPFRLKHFLKKPQLVQYMETDYDGFWPLNRWYYLSIRCSGIHDDVSENNGEYTVAPSAASPEIITNFKVFYEDKGL